MQENEILMRRLYQLYADGQDQEIPVISLKHKRTNNKIDHEHIRVQKWKNKVGDEQRQRFAKNAAENFEAMQWKLQNAKTSYDHCAFENDYHPGLFLLLLLLLLELRKAEVEARHHIDFVMIQLR